MKTGQIVEVGKCLGPCHSWVGWSVLSPLNVQSRIKHSHMVVDGPQVGCHSLAGLGSLRPFPEQLCEEQVQWSDKFGRRCSSWVGLLHRPPLSKAPTGSPMRFVNAFGGWWEMHLEEMFCFLKIHYSG